MRSSRLPGKVLLPLMGRSSLARMIERVRKSKYADAIVVATTIHPADDAIVSSAKELGVRFFRGSEQDVLNRVLSAAQSVQADIIVELTGDCPLMDWRLVNRGIEEFFNHQVDYASNAIKPTFPNGFDVQVFPTKILAEVADLTKDPIDRTHVSCYIYNHPDRYKLHNWTAGDDYFGPEFRVTLDEQADFQLLEAIFGELYLKNNDFSAADVVALLRQRPDLVELNRYVKQKEISEG